MLRKAIITAAVLAFVAILATTASPARASIEFKFFADRLTFDYDFEGDEGSPNARYLEIRSTNTSLVDGYLWDTVAGDPPIDGATFTASDNTVLVALLTMTDSGGGNWSASGTFSLEDTTGTVVARANVVSTGVWIDTGDNQYFKIRGLLSPNTGPAILQAPVVAPWKFVGTSNYLADNGSDGVFAQASIAGWAGYDEGTMLTIQILTGGGHTVDSFLGQDQTLDRGEASGTIVPVPPAVLLGFVGLCLTGWKLRKYA